MRRLALLLATCAVTAVAAVPARAAEPAPAPPSTPQAVPAAFAAAINARSLDASPCSLLTRDQRESTAVHELYVHDTLSTEPWDPAAATRLCDARIVRDVVSGSPSIFREWLRTEVGPARIVREAGDLVKLRARVVQRYRPERDGYDATEAGVVDLFVAREEGTWRLASAEGLMQYGIHAGNTTIAAFERERAREGRRTRRLVGGRARMLRELTTDARPFARETIDCDTGARATRSGRSEPAGTRDGGVFRIGDDADDRLVRVRDPRAARVDLVDARLSSGRGRLCWTFLLRGRVAERVDVELLIAEEGNDDEDANAMLTLRLDGGSAVGLGDGPYARPVFPLRASVHGRVVRVVAPASRVRGKVRLARPFGWSALTRAPDPDRAVGSNDQWVDMLPALNTWDDLAGIKHRPRR